MSIKTEVADRFRQDVLRHRIEVVRDDGVHRHVRFRAPRTCRYGFDLITWPGRLSIDGDMGTYVFSRLEDMFEFFRRPDGGINPSYWAEKLRSVDQHAPAREFCERKARAAFASSIEDWPATARSAAFAQLNDLLISTNDGEDGFREAVEEIKVEAYGREFVVSYFWECDLQEWTFRFLWNLHAIAWGIAQYDRLKQPQLAGGVA